MARKLSALYDDPTVAEVERLASEYEVPPQEVLRQLVEAGLEEAQRP
ncbi:hypothetical protein [Halarchaeum sp. P4]